MRMELVALLAAVLLFLVYLFIERFLLDRRLESVALRIAVTGTRGKSSVVRLLASILGADGRTVLAKTTGSEARYLMPDGNEVEVPRRGAASIIEQKKLIKKAADLGADCVVAEIMSIHPENHRIESHRLLRPQIVVLTNVRLDHTDAMGGTEDEIASVLSLGFTPGATVFVPEKENRQGFVAAAEELHGELIEVTGRSAGSADFPENLDLAWAVGRHLGISEEVNRRRRCRSRMGVPIGVGRKKLLSGERLRRQRPAIDPAGSRPRATDPTFLPGTTYRPADLTPRPWRSDLAMDRCPPVRSPRMLRSALRCRSTRPRHEEEASGPADPRRKPAGTDDGHDHVRPPGRWRGIRLRQLRRHGAGSR